MTLVSAFLTPWRCLVGLHHVFGRMGYVMVAIFLLCALWNIFLIILQIVPNQTANALMSTGMLDYGNFWRLPKPEPVLTMVAVLLLLCILLFYIYLVISMLVSTNRYFRKRITPSTAGSNASMASPRDPKKRRATVQQELLHQESSSGSSSRPSWRQLDGFFVQLVHPNGKYRKIYNVVLEIPECVLQTLTLCSYLQDGLVDTLVYVYVALILANCIVCFYFIQIAWKKPAFEEILVDALVDVVFTIVFPASVLLFCIATFDADLETLRIQQTYFPPQRFFDRGSQLYADAKQVSEFVNGFESLRIRSGWELLVRFSFNLLTCLRWRQILMTLRHKHLHKAIQEKSRPNPALTRAAVTQTPPKRVVPWVVGWCFLGFGVGLTAWAAKAIEVSHQACAEYQPCVVYAYEWRSPPLCPCLIYIDRDMAPNASTAIANKDSNEMIAEVSKAGQLRRLELVNRFINTTLPEELAQNTHLRQLILIYTELQELPAWTSKAFANLEYLHVEGNQIGTNLITVPDDLFSNMNALHTLYITGHPNLQLLPSFQGLSQLTTLYLSYLKRVKNITSFEGLDSLQILGIKDIPRLRTLPELTPFGKTIQRIQMQRVSLCCSGYLDNTECNTTHPLCALNNGERDSKCLPPINSGKSGRNRTAMILSNASRVILEPFLNDSSVCDFSQSVEKKKGSTTGGEDECYGIMYQQCANATGICFNKDPLQVECIKEQGVIDMRKKQIKEGKPCDPSYEKWLECDRQKNKT